MHNPTFTAKEIAPAKFGTPHSTIKTTTTTTAGTLIQSYRHTHVLIYVYIFLVFLLLFVPLTEMPKIV